MATSPLVSVEDVSLALDSEAAHITSIRHGAKATRFVDGRIAQGDQLATGDIWVSAKTGKILSAQEVPQDVELVNVVDLQGRILAPGLIDVQLNGAYGFNFSILPQDSIIYPKELIRINKALVQTGLTSYLPTLTSQPTEVYQTVLPYLGPSDGLRLADQGCESLGAHCEGPFLSRTKNGIHNRDNLLSAGKGFQDLEACYGHVNLSSIDGHPPRVKMVTAAPEVGNVAASIPELTERDIIVSLGNFEATYEEACGAVEAGASMVTHLFNAMQPLHHRQPGIIGLLGNSDQTKRPYVGVIADGIHLHPTVVNLAYQTNPEGFILVMDAMHLVGLPDGIYQWSNDGGRLVKKGTILTLEGTPDKIAGSSITLLQSVNNFLSWSNVAVPVALKAVTDTPAKMLGLHDVKGTLSPGADADLVVLDEVKHSNLSELVLEQTWKFGVKVYDEHDC